MTIMLRVVLTVLLYSWVVSGTTYPPTLLTSWQLPSYDDIYDDKTGCVPEHAFRGMRTAHLHLKRGVAYPVGVEKAGHILVNGLEIAPGIVGVEGETLQVIVQNDMCEGTTIHFHGMYQQNGLNLYDGPSHITQCPIPPKSNFTQLIAFKQAGAYWYHSHSGLQYSDGLRGPVIILPRCQRKELRGVESYVLGFSEHYLNTSYVLQPAYNSSTNKNGIPSPDSGVINGIGRYNCNGYRPPHAKCHDVARPWFATVEPGKIYYLRFVCMSTMGGFNISIADHKLTVIETDGDDVSPVTTDQVAISIGQRIGALITTKTRRNNYQIRIKMSLANVNAPSPYLNENFTAALHYQGSRLPTWDNLVNVNDTKIQHRLRDYGPGLAPLAWKAPTHVDKRIFVYWGFFQTTKNTTVYPFITYNVDGEYVNRNSTWVAQPLPLLGLVKLGKELPGKANPIFVKAGETVELVVQNVGIQPHIWHLHGYSYFVTAHGHSTTANVTAKEIAAATDLKGAAYRDSLWMPPFEWFALRFKADNPGVWIFHCHIEFHLITGMALNIVVGADTIKEKFHLTPDWWDLCDKDADLGILPPWNDVTFIKSPPGNHTIPHAFHGICCDDYRKDGHTCGFA